MHVNRTTMCWIVGLAIIPVVERTEHAHGDEYRQRREAIQARQARNRKVPEIPARGERLRCIIDTDAKNEIDDVWAISLALLCPERFQIEGFVAANYDNKVEDAGPGSVEGSAEVIKTVLEKFGLQDKIPVKRGSPPLRDQYEHTQGSILRCKDIDRDKTFALFHERLKRSE